MIGIRKNYQVAIGILLTLAYLSINLLTLNDYGVTWDYSYHFNAGLFHLGLPISDPSFIMGPSPPLSDTIPTISSLLFSKSLKLFPWDAAYNLYSVILGSLGVGILYFVIRELFSWKAGLLAAITLALLPRYFGHLHNNMKDIPQAVLFTLGIWTVWRLLSKQTIQRLLIAVIAFALSFNSKVNAIFIPLITIIYLAVTRYFSMVNRTLRYMKISPLIFVYFILAPLGAYLLWSLFWNDPIGRLLEARHSYTTSTTNMPILYFGNTVYSGKNVPAHFPLGILAATTPVVVSIFFLIGCIILLSPKFITKPSTIFLLVWFFLPLARYLKPQMIVIDDVRHFMEALFPFAAVAGIGMHESLRTMRRFIAQYTPMNNLSFPLIITTLYIFYLAFQLVSYHPFETSYFSETVGGIKGAYHKFDIEFWASAYKNALIYLNKNAPKNSKITVSMAPDIAKLYLRDDLKIGVNEKNLADVGSAIYSQSDYTVILNRESFFNWYGVYPYIKNQIPVYILQLDGIPLVSVYKN